ncbi:hypothetical protein [Paucibacter soli]|uniref:hypothetical protein n=1 Tax=Paucibacter soli TaxID=3133433 RepID=UPI0030B439C4
MSDLNSSLASATPQPAEGPIKADGGFDFGRYQFRYLRAKKDPWGHFEGPAHNPSQTHSQTIFELSTMIENGRKAGWRLILGRLALWVLI